ncbi:hypothetical protein DSO57_1009436 [Entomophthora muscae]|uniref:Uncharacterized protein n=1 Tax=Entomophthora muscae TaxID=34485 RepID=A0ACC2SVQ7_9FUNG|nr:hypothetical protein DSO57_1009436 [Entomophthora muscae]
MFPDPASSLGNFWQTYRFGLAGEESGRSNPGMDLIHLQYRYMIGLEFQSNRVASKSIECPPFNACNRKFIRNIWWAGRGNFGSAWDVIHIHQGYDIRYYATGFFS